MNLQSPYGRQNPFLASIKVRENLCKTGSQKETIHLVLDLKGSSLKYEVGDSLGVYPVNDPALVEKTLKILKATGDEIVHDKKGVSFRFKEYLSKHANLKGITRKIVAVLHQRLPEDKQGVLAELLHEDHKDALKHWMHTHEVWDLFEKYPEAHFTPQEVVDLLMPLLPRFYSIASSQAYVGEEVHLTVAYLRYETRGIDRIGVCTHYLCQLAPLNQAVVPVYIQPAHDFRLPPDPEASIIMVGPGTGVAPYRAFLQEREIRKDTGKNWLFFGEWTRTHEYFYEEDWESFRKKGLLKLDLAFSRDQSEKVYVQHKMLEAGDELFQWLSQGAIFYVCGDAHRMAKDVEETLLQIIQKHGQMDLDSARAYLKKMRQEKRYLRDVY